VYLDKHRQYFNDGSSLAGPGLRDLLQCINAADRDVSLVVAGLFDRPSKTLGKLPLSRDLELSRLTEEVQ
jgi:hypothetical protein